MTSRPANPQSVTVKIKEQVSSLEEGAVLDAPNNEIKALSASEKKIRDEVIKVVMNEINPLLLNLQKASNQIIQNSASAQAKSLEDGIKEKIERRMAKISSVMASRGI